MNFDPRTEAREEAESKKDKSLIAMYAGACAYLQAVYEETDSELIADAFEEVWDKAVKLIHPAEFYREVTKATKALGY
jgi:hypothetical protein